MTIKRDRIAIINDMLDYIKTKNGTAKPTHIMYKANLSNEMLADYIKELLRKNFITEHTDKKNKRTYQLTEKGQQFLTDYKQMKGFLVSYDLN